jgi:2-amino-4-hydroxy-6-hydroxymethyldihydropteridine diphosphokinase
VKLQGAVSVLEDTPEVTIVAVSSVYETEPVNAPEGSPPFLNLCVLIDTTLTVHTLLDRALAIEDAFGRERGEEVRNAPRTLDVDVIVVGDRRRNDEVMQLPHPRASERAFVLKPWYDVEPDAEIPDAGTVADLLERSDRSGLKKREDLVLQVQ